jgi:hypothetical protein
VSNLGKPQGPKNKPIRGIAAGELPGIIYAPTALGKLRSMQTDLDAYAAAYERGKLKTNDPAERKAIEHGLAILKLFPPMLLKAFELCRDSEKLPPNLRYCPDCPKWTTPLEKNNQRCLKHTAERRKIKNRFYKREQREREKSNVSKVSNNSKDT